MQARIMCIHIYIYYIYVYIYIFIRYSTLNTHIVVLESFTRPFKAKQIQTLPLPLCQADINDSPRLPSDWSPLEYELLECHKRGWLIPVMDGETTR